MILDLYADEMACILTLKREVGEEASVEVKLIIHKSNCRTFYYVIVI